MSCIWFLEKVQEQLDGCRKGDDPKAALDRAAKVTRKIPEDCAPNAQAALQGLLDAFPVTVQIVFAASGDLAVPRSEQEENAKQRLTEFMKEQEKIQSGGYQDRQGIQQGPGAPQRS